MNQIIDQSGRIHIDWINRKGYLKEEKMNNEYCKQMSHKNKNECRKEIESSFFFMIKRRRHTCYQKMIEFIMLI